MKRTRSSATRVIATATIVAAAAGIAALGAPAIANQNQYNYPAAPSQYDTMPYRGVNLAGMDYEYEFQAPSIQDGAFYAAAGMNTIRLPFKWEYLQSRSDNKQDRSSNPADTIDWSSPKASTYASLVQGYTERGMHVILDMHNYMRYAGQIIGTPGAATAENYAAAWKTIAAKFAGNPLVSFDLMNEPREMSSTVMLANYNTAIAAVREVANNLILLEGNGWSGAHSWTQNWMDSDPKPRSNAEVFVPANIHDPANNYMINVHQYFDGPLLEHGGYSGTKECKGGGHIPNIDGLTTWLRQNNLKAIVTETGGLETSNCAADTNAFLKHIEAKPEFVGFTGWAGGTPGMGMTQYFGPSRDGNGVTITMSDGYQPNLRRPGN